MEESFKVNRRSLDRVKTEIQAEYFIKKQSVRYEGCTVIDISRSGAAIRFPAHEKLQKGAIVFLDIVLPGSFRKLTLQGELKRIQVKGNENIGGIRFQELLDKLTFHDLIYQLQ